MSILKMYGGLEVLDSIKNLLLKERPDSGRSFLIGSNFFKRGGKFMHNVSL